MILLPAFLLLASCGWKLKQEAPGYRVYVTNETSGELTVIDSAEHKFLANIPVGKRPRGIRASADGKTIYIALSGSPLSPPGVDPKTLPPPDRSADGIAVVDTDTLKVTRVIRAGQDPEQIDLSRDGRKLYVANEDVERVSVVNLETDKIEAEIAVGEEPEGVTVSPDGAHVYVTSEGDGAVFIIDTATNKVVKQVAVGERPRSVEFLPDGSKAYVTVENDAVIAVIDARKQELMSKISVGGKEQRPMGFALSKDAKRLFASTGRGNKIAVIDTAENKMTGEFFTKERPWGVGLSPDGSTLYAANGISNEVAAIDVATGRQTRRIPTGKRPWGVLVLPAPVR
jgi:YVTN family beta-propeller protein